MTKFLVHLLLALSFYSFSFDAQNIFEASRNGDVSRIKQLMAVNPDTINKPNENGFSPLIIACYRNQKEVVEFLLNQNVNVNFNSPEGTALIGTCYKGNLEIAALLLNNKANVNAQNENGTTALIFAVQANHLQLVTLLLSKNAAKESKEKSGRTALDYARENQNKDIIDLLSK